MEGTFSLDNLKTYPNENLTTYYSDNINNISEYEEEIIKNILIHKSKDALLKLRVALLEMISTANAAYAERTLINRKTPKTICKDIYILITCLADENTDNLDSVYQTQSPLDEGTEGHVEPNMPVSDTEPTLQDIVKEILALKKTTESQNLAITTLSHDNEKLSIRADQLMAENDALKQRVAILD